MRFYKLCLLSFSIVIFTNYKVFSQAKSLSIQERRVTELYSKLTKFIQQDYDSINFYSESFEKEFTSLVKNNPATLSYSFKKLIDSNFCFIKTSSDGNFRIYSWDTWTGGTQHVFKEIYQWKTKGKIFIKMPKYEDGDPGGFCSKLFTVNLNKNPYYFAITNSILSSKDAVQSIAIYNIKAGNLVDTTRLFRTKTQKLNRIDVDYDFFIVVDRPERPLELITYDAKNKIIYIPVVDEKGQVTKRNILYKLQGGNFEFISIETGIRK